MNKSPKVSPKNLKIGCPACKDLEMEEISASGFKLSPVQTNKISSLYEKEKKSSKVSSLI